MSTILDQLKKQKEVEKTTLENLDTNINNTDLDLDAEFEASLESLDDAAAMANSAIDQIIRIGTKASTNESFSDEVVELEKSIAHFHGADASTLEALDELKNAAADSEATVTLLAKGSLFERVKLWISRLIASFKLALKKFASKDSVKAMEKFQTAMDEKFKELKSVADKEAKFKSSVASVADLDKLGAAYNTAVDTLKSLADAATVQTKNLKTSMNFKSTIDMGSLVSERVVKSLGNTLGDTAFESATAKDMQEGKPFLVAKKDFKVEEVTLKDAASDSNLKSVQDAIKVPKPAKDLYASVAELTKQAQKLTEEASGKLNEEDGVADASAIAKSAGKMLKLAANIAKAEKLLGSFVTKELKAYANAIAKNAEKK